MEKIRFLYLDMRADQACSSPLKHSCTKRESLHVNAGAVAPGDDRSLRIRALTLMDEQIGQKQASHCLLSPLPSFLAGSLRFGGTLFRKKEEGRAFPTSIACRAVSGVCRANLFRSRETTNCLKQELVTRFPGSEVCFLSERVVKGEGVRKLSGLWPDEHRASFPPKSGALTQTSYPV